MGGLMTGIFWGALVSAVGLAVVSLSVPLPSRDGGADAGAVAVEASEAGMTSAGAVAEATSGDAGGGVLGTLPAGDGGESPVEINTTAEGSSGAATGPATEASAAGGDTGSSAPASEIPLPSGSEFNRPPPEPEAAVPAPDAAPRPTAPQAPSLVSEAEGGAPSLDTTPAAQPRVVAEGPARITTELGEASTPASLSASTGPMIAGGPSALTQPEASATPQVSTAPAPQVTDGIVTGDAEATGDAGAGAGRVQVADPAAAAPAEPELVPLQAPVFPAVGEGTVTGTTTPDVPADVPTDLGPDAAAGGAIDVPVSDVSAPALPLTAGLLQVAPGAEGTGTGTWAVPAQEEVARAPADHLRAIEAYAAPFDSAEARPLMAVVLIDDPESGIELSTQTRFTFPVAFAVDPLHPDAAERASAYRAAGFEVVILGAMIPEGAGAADAEAAWAAAARTLPEAVAVIDTPQGRIQGDRPVLDAMVGALLESGHGLLAFPNGLNAAERSALRAGVPAATVFRFLDQEGERATVITRFLSRASFAAVQEDHVIVVGRTRPDTVTALFSWALGGRSEGVALAPLSATLMRASAP